MFNHPLPHRVMSAMAAMSAAVGLCASVHAQDPAASYPSKAITIIVPFAAGGNTDVKTRLVAKQLGEILKQPVIVDNRPGASGNIGIELLTRAVPDGYTLAMGSFGPLAVNPWIYPKLNFDPKSRFLSSCWKKAHWCCRCQPTSRSRPSPISCRPPRPSPAR